MPGHPYATIVTGLAVLCALTAFASSSQSHYRVYKETSNSKNLVMILDKSAVVWDGESGKLRFRITGHKEQISRVDISPDGTYVLTNSHKSPNQFNIKSKDNSIRLWDVRTGKQVLRILDAVYSCFSRDGKRIYGFLLKRGAKVSEPIYDLASWDTRTGHLLDRYVLAVPASVGGSYLLQENFDASKLLFSQASINVVDLRKSTDCRITEINLHGSDNAFFSESGNEVQLGRYQYLSVVSTLDGKETRRINVPEENYLHRIGWAPDGSLFASCDPFGNVLSYNHNTDKFAKSESKVEATDSVRFCQNGKLFAINWGGVNGLPVQTTGYDALTCRRLWTSPGWVVGLSTADNVALVDKTHLSIIQMPTGLVLRRVKLEKRDGDEWF